MHVLGWVCCPRYRTLGCAPCISSGRLVWSVRFGVVHMRAHVGGWVTGKKWLLPSLAAGGPIDDAPGGLLGTSLHDTCALDPVLRTGCAFVPFRLSAYALNVQNLENKPWCEPQTLRPSEPQTPRCAVSPGAVSHGRGAGSSPAGLRD